VFWRNAGMLRLSHFLAREMACVCPKNASMSVGRVHWASPKFARSTGSQLFLSVVKEVDQKHGPLSFISKLNAVVKSHNRII
jgi:hypothetical protein